VGRAIKDVLWKQGILRHSHNEIMEAAVRDWQAVLAFKSNGPFFFGDEPTGTDAIVFGTLASTVLTPIDTPIRAFLRSQPDCLAYAERMLARFYPELAKAKTLRP
jgi:glutathione S-transferase